MEFRLKVNGQGYEVDTLPNKRLLDVLREDLGLMGTKEGCGQGECGACTVIMDGKAVNSCMIYVGSVGDKEILTIEGIAKNDEQDILQNAFIEEGAVQCGFCTPGMILSAEALLKKNPDATEEDIRRSISGNLCRCTGYSKIIKAIQTASNRMKEGGQNEL